MRKNKYSKIFILMQSDLLLLTMMVKMPLVLTSVHGVTWQCSRQRSVPLGLEAITPFASLVCPATGPWMLGMLWKDQVEKHTAVTATNPSEYLQAIFLPDSMYTVS